jgi:ribosomal protein S27AE
MDNKAAEKEDNKTCPKCGERLVMAGTTWGEGGEVRRYQCTSEPHCNGKKYPFKTTKPNHGEVKEPKTA